MKFLKISTALLLVLFCAAPFVIAQTDKASPTPAVSPVPVSQSTPVSVSPTTSINDNDSLPFMKESQPDSHAAPSAGGMLLRTVGALLLVVGLIVAAAWAMKRFGGARFGKAVEDAPELSVLNSVALGDKRSLAVVRFGDRTLLLGSTQQSITLLAEAPGEPLESSLPSVGDMLSENASFADELSIATPFDPGIVQGANAQW